MDGTRRVTRSTARRTGPNPINGSSTAGPRPSFLSRLASAQSSQSAQSSDNNARHQEDNDPPNFSPHHTTGSHSRQDSDNDTEAATLQEESYSAVPAARRLFHQFRAPRNGSPGYDDIERHSRTPEVAESESGSDLSEEASYLANHHPMAMANQRLGNGYTSPSATLSLSAATNLNHAGRYSYNRQQHSHAAQIEDEEVEEVEEVEEYEGSNSDGGAAEDEDEEEDEEELEEEDYETPLNPSEVGLKEISNLSKFTVNSYKHGNGVEELRSDDLKLLWQSDGPQPHKLTMYFIKRVSIRAIRFYVNFNEDESYTPTKIVFKSGTSENNLIEFASLELTTPVGWQDVPMQGCGGGLDGNTLVSYVLQMVILENHQNGKDTHLRGIKIYALDHEERAPGGDGLPAIEPERIDLTPGLDIRGDAMSSRAPLAVLAAAGVVGEPKTEAEVARQKRMLQEAALDDWVSESLLRGPGSVASMSLR